jgi:hypothetical protein
MDPNPTRDIPLGLQGTTYTDTIPDTLDLAQRAELGLNYLTGMINPKRDYEMAFHAWYGEYSVPVLHSHMTALMACQAKAMEALAFLRIMSGSRLNLEREARMAEMMASHIGEEGIFWVPRYSDKPWLGPQDCLPYANVHGQALMMRAMLAWHQYTGDPAWKERIDRMVRGVDRLMVVHKDDYAYFPVRGWLDEEYLRSCYVKDKGWKDTSEPADEKSGEEGSLFNHQGHSAGVLATWYMQTGNEQALRLSGELVRFVTKPQFWSDWPAGEYPFVEGAQHAHWRGHYHGQVNTLRAVLEYAIATDDARLKAFVRDGYEWTRQSVLARIGFLDYQGCATGRLIGLAIKLSDAGVGDYWEDVDQYIRNHGVELQITPEDVPFLRGLAEGKSPPPDDPALDAENAMERSIGGFALWSDKSWTGLCCGTHGNMGLFYAWDGILRHADGTVRVNLLLNRASPWMDVHSDLPYVGRAVLKNKSAREVFVRIPLWVRRSALRCTLRDQELTPAWFGSYLRVKDLRPGDVLTIEFPVGETTEEWHAHEIRWPGRVQGELTTYTCRFRGNTLVEIDPPLGPNVLLYAARRQLYARPTAPIRKATRYVAPLVLDW